VTPADVNPVVSVSAVVALGIVALAGMIGAISVGRLAGDVRRVARSASEALDGLGPLRDRLAERCKRFREHPETSRGVVAHGWASALNQ